MLAALADGELDLLHQPELFAQLAQDAESARQVAGHHRLRQAVAQAMDGPSMKCPDDLAATLSAMAAEPSAQPLPISVAPPAVRRSPGVLARIGRWAPTAVAAVLMFAAVVVFMQPADAGSGPALLAVSKVEAFDGRHLDCAKQPRILHDHDRFGEAGAMQQLPTKLGEYFQTSTDGMRLNLSNVGYEYQLTGVCGLPGDGSVHIVYRHRDNPDRAISLWIRPDDGSLKNLEADRVYVEAGKTLDHPVIVWRNKGMVYYLVGDSLEDAHHAVDALRDPV